MYTAGVKWMCDRAGAYWLVDLIASHQHDPLARAEEFQVWHLKVSQDRSAMAWMTDGNDETPIIAQKIEWTDYADHGESECELYLVRSPGQPAVLMQPCEY